MAARPRRTRRVTDYSRGDARIVRVSDFELAFALFAEEHQLALALLLGRDN